MRRCPVGLKEQKSISTIAAPFPDGTKFMEITPPKNGCALLISRDTVVVFDEAIVALIPAPSKAKKKR